MKRKRKRKFGDKKNKIVEVQHIVDKDVQSAKEINIKFIKTYNSLMDEITAKFNHLNLKDINLTYEDLETEISLNDDAGYTVFLEDSIETLYLKEKKIKFIGVKHIKDETIQSTKKINIYGVKTYHLLIEEILKHYQNLKRNSFALTYLDSLVGEINLENDADFEVFLKDSQKIILLKEKKTTIEVKYANNEAVEITKTIDIANITTYYSLIKEILKQYDHLDINDIALTYKSSTCKNSIKINNDYDWKLFICDSYNTEILLVEKTIVKKWRMLNFENMDNISYGNLYTDTLLGLEEFYVFQEDGKPFKGIFMIVYDTHNKLDESVKSDVETYEKIAILLGFSEETIFLMNNPTRKELFDKIDRYKKHCRSEDDCFILAYIGSGNSKFKHKNVEYWQGEHIILADAWLSVKDLIQIIVKCEVNVNGPTILFLETCRGDLVESPYKFEDGIISQTQVKDEETSTTNFKNLIVVYATIPNSMAVTISNYGSLFTNVLYKQILLNEGSEFHEILTKVNNEVANTILTEDLRQVSCFRSSFTKSLYFRPKMNKETNEVGDNLMMKGINELMVVPDENTDDYNRVESSDVSRVESSDVSRVESSDMSRVESSNMGRVESSDMSRVESSDVSRVESSGSNVGEVKFMSYQPECSSDDDEDAFVTSSN